MSVRYIIKEGLSGFRRAKLATAGSLITIVLALLLLGLFYVVSTNTSRLVERIRSKVEMEAFLQEPISQQRIGEIQKQIRSMEEVDSVDLITKDEAARIFKEEFGEDVKGVLDFNPLPPSFKISLKENFRTSDKAESLSKAIRAIKGVDEVVYHREMLQFIEKQANVLYLIGLALGIVIGFSAIFLVSNTIRLTIYAKRKSIQTMKLVGASRWFVRAPFLIEGLVQGLFGGLLATGLLYYLLNFTAQLISAELAEFIHVDTTFYGCVILTGMLLGLFGSVISVRKFIGETVSG